MQELCGRLSIRNDQKTQHMFKFLKLEWKIHCNLILFKMLLTINSLIIFALSEAALSFFFIRVFKCDQKYSAECHPMEKQACKSITVCLSHLIHPIQHGKTSGSSPKSIVISGRKMFWINSGHQGSHNIATKDSHTK